MAQMGFARPSNDPGIRSCFHSAYGFPSGWRLLVLAENWGTRRMIRRFVVLVVSFCLSLLAAIGFAADANLQSLADAGHWKRLRAIVEPRLASNANDAEAAYRMAQVKHAYGDLDGALALAERAVAAQPRNADYHVQVADICVDKADDAGIFKGLSLAHRSKSELQTALDLDPKNVEARWYLFVFDLQAPGIAGGDKKQARILAEELAKISAVEGYLAQGRIARVEKNVAAEEDAYGKAVAADPKSSKARISLARFYNAGSRKNLDEAEKQAREAVRIDPGRANGYQILAAVYAETERWKDLDAILADAEKNVPDNLNPAFQAGKTVLLVGKDYPRAERYFRQYLTQEPEGDTPKVAEAHFRLGQTLERQGHKAEAITELETSIRLDASLKDAKQELKKLK